MIRCPHCLHDESTVKETKTDRGDYLLRYRTCNKCHKVFPTHETLAVFVSKKRGYVRDLEALLEQEFDG